MSGSFEKSVKGGTKIKLAAPKAKYVEHILVATHAGEAGVAEIFRALQNRLRDSTWTIVFKALIIVHLMIREGEPNVTLKYLADSPSKLAISNFSDVQVQGTNIRHYYACVLCRAKAFRDTKIDWVREGQGRLKKQTISKGLLRETKTVQSQINALLKCDVSEQEVTSPECGFGTLSLKLAEHYFEMSKYDAEQALEIYKTFSKQTDRVVQFLSVARQYEKSTRLEIPKLRHAPTSLTSSLEEYLNDPDFEINRRQYLAQQEAKKGKTFAPSASTKPAPKAQNSLPSRDFPEPKNLTAAPATRHEAKGPAPDLIDFFDSIESNQQPIATQPQQATSSQNGSQYAQQPQSSVFPTSTQGPFGQNGLPQQQQMGNLNPQNNPFAQIQGQAQQPMQPGFTGTGFGGYSQQPLVEQQNQFAPAPQNNTLQSFPAQSQQPPDLNQPSQQSTNPFRQTSMPTGISTTSFANSSTISSPLSRQGTNPFARNNRSGPVGQSQNSPFTSPPPQQPSQPFPQQPPQPFPQSASQPLQPHRTGTNPFARNISPPSAQTSTPSPLMPNVTGSTNPFRQSTFVNQQTGQGWQSNQGSIGGLEHLDTVPVFPRPGQPQHPQQQQAPWL
ncbi:MAG: hypothetical protein Q9181_006311 [Wetmoreana brouardii]